MGNLILDTSNPKLVGYQDFSIQCFSSFNEFDAYTELVKSKADNVLLDVLDRERSLVDQELQKGTNLYKYGMFDKHPRSYAEAMERKDFVYKDQYDKIKSKIQAKVLKALEKNSVANAMKDRMVFNDRELGEFVYERAAMSLLPNLYFYSRLHNKVAHEDEVKEVKEVTEVDSVNKTETKYIYKVDGTELVLCVKVTKKDGGEEYVEVHGDGDLSEASDKGIVSVSSNVKKVYQFKEKQPRIKNAVKILVGLTYGGYTAWKNDFYTGIAAVIVAEHLESLGYAVHLEVIIGGGRCTGCLAGGYALNTKSRYGRRFVTITAKDFNTALDTNTLLYWVSDPSALYIKMLRNFNVFHWLYGDTLNFSSTYWHGIEKSDMVNPIGTYERHKDIKEVNKDLLYYMLHQVKNEDDVAASVLDIVLTSETINKNINDKAISKNF